MYNKGNKRDDKGGKKPFVKTTAARKTSAADRGRPSSSRPKSNDGDKRFSAGGRKKEESSPYKKRTSDSDKPYSRKPSGDRDSRPTDRRRTSDSDKPFTRRTTSDRDSRPTDRRRTSDSDKPFTRRTTSDRDSRPTDRRRTSDSDKPFTRRTTSDRDSRPTDRRRTSDSDKPFTRRTTSDRDSRPTDRRRTGDSDKPFTRKASSDRDSRPTDRRRAGDSDKPFSKPRTFRNDDRTDKPTRFDDKPKVKSRSGRGPSKSDMIFDRKKARKDEAVQDGNIRLNRYISNAGICSRREADDLIGAGLVTVNGKVITEMGYQVKSGDDVRYNGERLSREKKVYLLLNKPKDAITTFDDPEGRRTVMELFGKELGERVYPVGRLDRNTTGVLVFTNDGDLAQRLMHPKYEMKKVYKASLNKTFKGEDMWQLTNGVELEDGFVQPDAVAFPDPKDKTEVGIEIHSGKNRIIHRMFEHLGYKVDKLDRALYAGLTKGKLKRGEWRELTEKEVNALKRLVKLG